MHAGSGVFHFPFPGHYVGGFRSDDPNLNDLSNLGIALALGLLIGIQRGWVTDEGAGRTDCRRQNLSLVGLLGGISAILARDYGPWVIPTFLICISLVVIAAYWRSQDRVKDLSITSVIGTLLTYSFGLLAGKDYGPPQPLRHHHCHDS